MGIGGAAAYGLALLAIRRLELLGALSTRFLGWALAGRRRSAVRGEPLRTVSRAVPSLERNGREGNLPPR